MKTLFFILFTAICINTSYAQEKYLTKSGLITFFSHSPVEDIKADNKQVLSIIDTSNGKIAIAILMKSFSFEKSLMQEHFNENYVESDKYPKATFKGNINNFENLTEGKQTITILGKLTIHGATKEIEITADADWTKSLISLTGDFNIDIADYNIDIPSVVKNNIAKSIKVSFNLNHKLYK